MNEPLTLPHPPQPARLPQRSRPRLLHACRQAALVLVAIALLAWFGLAVRAGLARNGIAFDMGFLNQVAGFDISEGWVAGEGGLRPFQSGDSNASALLAGFLNTLKVAALAMGLSTVAGVWLGLGRLSGNWLVRQLSFGLVELVRNTPLLIQLVFWYFAVVLKMPGLDQALHGYGGLLFSRQGVYLPGLAVEQGAAPGAVWALMACMALLAGAFASRRWRKALAVAGLLALGASIAWGFPLALARPEVRGFTVEAGLSLSPEFIALLLALTVHTAAFIAEIVRGAIVALPRGQWEAAAALGLGRWPTQADVVLPQALRVVLPAFGNQYISLAKNTSLGIAIGFPDLFNVYGTVANQSGRSLEGVIVVMLAYLALSWSLSGAVNRLNRRLAARGGVQ